MNHTLIAQLREYDTAMIANTIGFTSRQPPEAWYMSGLIRSLTPMLGPTVGYAVTCELDSSSPGSGDGDMADYWRQLEHMTAMNGPSVWVVKAVGSRPDHECVMGDGMGKTLFAAGCVGIVTDGGVRDLHGLRSIPFAAYARQAVIHHGPMRMRRINAPVNIGGITVTPGEIIHAGPEGVVRIPPDCLDRLIQTADANVHFEREAHAMLRRTDLSPRDKQRRVQQLMDQYGLADCVSASPPRNVARDQP